MNFSFPDFFRFTSKDKKPNFWGNIFQMWAPIPYFNTYAQDVEKLKKVLSNPALLKVICLQCDLFSLGKFYVYENDKQIDNDPLVSMLNKPNPFQSRQQFLWDFMFWNMIGNDYLYVDSKIPGEGNKLYFLTHDKMFFPQEFKFEQDKLILSTTTQKAIDGLQIRYTFVDGTRTYLKWANVIHWSDLSNGIGNWFKGNSRIDALCKVIDNSEAALDAKYTNTLFSGRFIVAGKQDPSNVSERPLGEKEKQKIEDEVNGFKSVHAIKSMVDIKRFVENIGNLKLDESYLSSYFLIGSMYGIPKDVLEANISGSTYENQEKARGAHVSYCLQPKGDDLCEKLTNYFGYTTKRLVIDWEHLPFMQVFANDRMKVSYLMSRAILNLQAAGLGLSDINEVLDTNFKKLTPKPIQNVTPPNTNPQTGAGQP